MGHAGHARRRTDDARTGPATSAGARRVRRAPRRSGRAATTEGRWTQRLHGEEYKGLGTGARAGRERRRRSGHCSTRATSDAARAGGERRARAGSRSSRTASRTGPTSSAGAAVRRRRDPAAVVRRRTRASSSPRPTTSTRSCCSPVRSWSWKAGPPTTGEGRPVSATARRATAMRCSPRSGAQVTRSGSRGRGAFAAHALGQVERERSALLALDRRRRRRGLRRRLPRGKPYPFLG